MSESIGLHEIKNIINCYNKNCATLEVFVTLKNVKAGTMADDFAIRFLVATDRLKTIENRKFSAFRLLILAGLSASECMLKYFYKSDPIISSLLAEVSGGVKQSERLVHNKDARDAFNSALGILYNMLTRYVGGSTKRWDRLESFYFLETMISTWRIIRIPLVFNYITSPMGTATIPTLATFLDHPEIEAKLVKLAEKDIESLLYITYNYGYKYPVGSREKDITDNSSNCILLLAFLYRKSAVCRTAINAKKDLLSALRKVVKLQVELGQACITEKMFLGFVDGENSLETVVKLQWGDRLAKNVCEHIKLCFQRCMNCGKSEQNVYNLQVCSGCRLVRYCSRKCQKQQWKYHKAACLLSRK